MTESKVAVDTAIQNLLDTYQKLADEEKLLMPKREAAQQRLDQLVDEFAEMETFDESKVSAEMTAAYLIFQGEVAKKMRAGDLSVQMSTGKFSGDLLQDFGTYMMTVQGNEAKMKAVQQAGLDLSKDMPPPQIEVGTPMMGIASGGPDGDYGEWSFTFTFAVMDENFQVKLADKLDFDFIVTMKITPPEGLSGEFNTPSMHIKAGDKVQNLSVSAKTSENDQPKYLMTSCDIYKNGTLIQQAPFPPMQLKKPDPNTMDMNALMNAMQDKAPGGHRLH